MIFQNRSIVSLIKVPNTDSKTKVPNTDLLTSKGDNMAIQQIRKNAIEDVYITATNKHSPGTSVTVASATFQVYDADGTSVQAVASATITDNSTVSPDINGLVDTSVSGFTANEWYEVVFIVTIGSEEYHEVVSVECVEGRL